MKIDEGHQGLDRACGRPHSVVGVGQQVLADVDQQLPEEAFFALEMAVDGRSGDPNGTSDVIESDRAVTALHEQRRRRVQELLSRRPRAWPARGGGLAFGPATRLRLPGPAPDAHGKSVLMENQCS